MRIRYPILFFCIFMSGCDSPDGEQQQQLQTDNARLQEALSKAEIQNIDLAAKVQHMQAAVSAQRAIVEAQQEANERKARVAAECDIVVPVCPHSWVVQGRVLIAKGYAGTTWWTLVGAAAGKVVLGAWVVAMVAVASAYSYALSVRAWLAIAVRQKQHLVDLLQEQLNLAQEKVHAANVLAHAAEAERFKDMEHRSVVIVGLEQDIEERRQQLEKLDAKIKFRQGKLDRIDTRLVRSHRAKKASTTPENEAESLAPEQPETPTDAPDPSPETLDV